MSKTYNTYIFLRPLQPWFFGTESGHELGKSSDYFTKSTLFPQQTQVLGLLRYLILMQEGLLDGYAFSDNRSEALIGKRSFDYANINNQMYGKIHGLSTIFMGAPDSIYPVLPMDWGLDIKKVEKLSGYGNYPLSLNSLPHLIPMPFHPFADTYNAKDGLTEFCRKGNNEIPLYGEKDTLHIIDVVTNPGNRKNRNGKVNEDGYYKKQFNTFNKKFSESGFSFYVNTDHDFSPLNNSVIEFGGERSPFLFRVEKGDSFTVDFDSIYVSPSSHFHKITCISDVFVSSEILDLSAFAITEIIPFRNIITQVSKTKSYSALSRNDTSNEQAALLKSKLQLIKRGSVFYFDDLQKLQKSEEMINYYKNFQQIGYNNFQTYINQ